MIEDTIGWILKGAEGSVLVELKERIDRDFDDIDSLIALFKVKSGPGRLKTDYLAFQEVGGVISLHAGCLIRAEQILAAVTMACLGNYQDCPLIKQDEDQSGENCLVLRLMP
jgi:hypothetical protein